MTYGQKELGWHTAISGRAKENVRSKTPAGPSEK